MHMILPMQKLLLVFIVLFTFSACSKSDDQRRFEDEASVEPQGITETTASGEVLAEDPGDWRISPMYQGLITVQPAYPNPVDFNANLILQVDFNVPNAVSYIGIYYFELPTIPFGPIEQLDQSNLMTFNTITIPASAFASESGGSSGSTRTFRILIYDGNENLITYGDVRIK